MTAASILFKASLLLAAATLVVLVGRRSSAASRHQVWTLAVVGLLLLPLLSFSLPRWTAITFTAPQAIQAVESTPVFGEAASPAEREFVPTPTRIEMTTSSSRVTGITGSMTLTVLYAAGIIVLLARLVVGRLGIRRLARHATAVTDADWVQLFTQCADDLRIRRSVRLLRSRDQTMPMMFGIRRPTILIPNVADTWTEDRRRSVLLHELAHVARHDCLIQMLGAVACALYWVHPGVWWVARRLRVERELACDDCVLSAGTHAGDYAGHLLEIAYSLGRLRAPALAVSMAASSQLEGRMLAVLDVARNRATPALRSRLAGAAIMAALLVPVAAASTSMVTAHSDGDFAVEGPDLLRDPVAVKETPAQVARVASAQSGTPGTWEIRPTTEAGRVHLRLTEEDGVSGFTIAVDRLSGLAPGQLTANGTVQFSLRYDAGTFNFEGIVRNGVAAGTYTFAPNAAFAAELVKRGFSQPSTSDLRQLARGDMGLDFVEELSRQSYARPTLADLIRASQHGVGISYLREMGQLGYRMPRLDALVTLRDHGVSPQFARDLRGEGFKDLTADDLVRARDHGVGPEYIDALRQLGFTTTLDGYVKARDHGIVPEYVQSLRQLGYRPSLDGLISVRDHGVVPEYISDMSKLGYTKLSMEALVNARDHGITPDYVRGLRDLGYTASLEDTIGARDHGITSDYIRSMKTAGYDRVSLDELIRLRDHGVTPQYVGQLKTLGFTGLSVDEIIRLRDQGSWSDVLLNRLRDGYERVRRGLN